MRVNLSIEDKQFNEQVKELIAAELKHISREEIANLLRVAVNDALTKVSYKVNDSNVKSVCTSEIQKLVQSVLLGDYCTSLLLKEEDRDFSLLKEARKYIREKIDEKFNSLKSLNISEDDIKDALISRVCGKIKIST